MLKRRFVFLFLMLLSIAPAFAQQDSTVVSQDTVRRYVHQRRPMSFLDSVARAIKVEEKQVSDSLALIYIKRPDPNRINLFIDSILRANAYNGNHYLDMQNRNVKANNQGYGHVRPSRDPWVIITIVVLLLFTAALNIYANKDMSNVFLSFYSQRSASVTGKEDSPINAWTFIGLFLLFGFTFGLFLYLLTTGYYKVYYTLSGPQLFLSLSLVIIGLFGVKFLVLRFLGFVFDINKLVSDYINTLSLTYFNITFVFLPVALCFSLIADAFIPYLLGVTLLLAIVIFVWQYLRSSVGIISNFQFHKFYLFIYLCALEICPILIMIKALNIGFR